MFVAHLLCILEFFISHKHTIDSCVYFLFFFHSFLRGQLSVVFVIILVLFTFPCGFRLKTLFTIFLKLWSNHLQLSNTVHFYLWPAQRTALNLVLLCISEGSSSILTSNTLKSKDGDKTLLSVSVIPLQILHSLKISCLEIGNSLYVPSDLKLFVTHSCVFLAIEVLILPCVSPKRAFFSFWTKGIRLVAISVRIVSLHYGTIN